MQRARLDALNVAHTDDIDALETMLDDRDMQASCMRRWMAKVYLLGRNRGRLEAKPTLVSVTTPPAAPDQLTAEQRS